MYLNISETSTDICLKLKIYMTYHKLDMWVKFHNSVLHFDKVMPFLSILICLQSILDNMSGQLYKFYTNRRTFFKLDSNVHPNWAMCKTHLTLVPALSRTLVGVWIAFSDSSSYNCNAGYTFHGSTTRYCQANHGAFLKPIVYQ